MIIISSHLVLLIAVSYWLSTGGAAWIVSWFEPKPKPRDLTPSEQAWNQRLWDEEMAELKKDEERREENLRWDEEMAAQKKTCQESPSLTPP